MLQIIPWTSVQVAFHTIAALDLQSTKVARFLWSVIFMDSQVPGEIMLLEPLLAVRTGSSQC